MSLVGSPYVMWWDEVLAWNRSKFGGVRCINAFQNDIWRPQLFLGSPLDNSREVGLPSTPVKMTDGGLIIWYPADVFTFWCTVNTRFYLIGTQLCYLDVGAKVYTVNESYDQISESYDQTLSEIQEILNKYTTTHVVLLLGDMNASLKCRPNNAQDVKLKKFCEINNLLSKQKGEHTFLHVNGKDNAEIDYILFNVKAQSLIRTIKTETCTDISTSDHIPVTSTLKFKAIEIDKNIAEIKVKPKWEKCDTQLYSYYIANQLHPFNSPQSDYEFVLSLGQFVSTLKNAVKISIPGHRDSRRVNPLKLEFGMRRSVLQLKCVK